MEGVVFLSTSDVFDDSDTASWTYDEIIYMSDLMLNPLSLSRLSWHKSMNQNEPTSLLFHWTSDPNKLSHCGRLERSPGGGGGVIFTGEGVGCVMKVGRWSIIILFWGARSTLAVAWNMNFISILVIKTTDHWSFSYIDKRYIIYKNNILGNREYKPP